MSAVILGLLAETFIHPGSGQADGTVDLPVAREGGTDYPFVPGSGVKGALRDAFVSAPGTPKENADRLFGKQDNAGYVLVSDARLLLLPVRSLTGAYRWLTCPHLIERFLRDRRRADPSFKHASFAFPDLDKVKGRQPAALASGAERLFLEERTFAVAAAPPADLVTLLGAAIADDGARSRLAGQLTVIHDDDFAWFARYALAVQARNSLQSKAAEDGAPNPKTSTALWYEETLPPDTVMYLLLAERKDGAAGEVAGHFQRHPYLQLGGNETTGQGQFLVGETTAAKEG